MSHLLNTAQHTALAVVLCYFEQSLRQAEMWLQGQQTVGVLYQSSLQLSAERRAAMSARIAEALEGITHLAERFDLRPVDEPLANGIAAEMSVNWANLIDTRSDKLGRYGPTDPRLRELLDPEIGHLAQLALSIASLARQESKEVFNEPDESNHGPNDL
jgi:hypothetical protein